MFFRLLITLVPALLMLSAVATVSGRPVSVENGAEMPRGEPIPQEVKLIFAGDIMLSRGIGKIVERKQDYTFPFASTTELFHSADIVFANLENPVSTGGVRSGSIYSFRADPQTLGGLLFAGVGVVSIANNHIWDYGREAFRDTLANLSENGIIAVGGGENYEEAHTPKVVTVGKTRVAFLAYTNLISAYLGGASSTPAVSRFTDDILKTDIAKARELADVVIVSFHWGEEYETKHNREQERVAKLTIDAGANLIVGHHPHVVQEVEEYNGGYIFYSLGNFVFDQNFSEDTGKGLLMEVTLTDGNITSVTRKEVVFGDDYQPYFFEGTVSSE
ncbi:MAG: CapA family protein [bacterium]|nr:CapA family protein [bacterium]